MKTINNFPNENKYTTAMCNDIAAEYRWYVIVDNGNLDFENWFRSHLTADDNNHLNEAVYASEKNINKEKGF